MGLHLPSGSSPTSHWCIRFKTHRKPQARDILHPKETKSSPAPGLQIPLSMRCLSLPASHAIWHVSGVDSGMWTPFNDCLFPESTAQLWLMDDCQNKPLMRILVGILMDWYLHCIWFLVVGGLCECFDRWGWVNSRVLVILRLCLILWWVEVWSSFHSSEFSFFWVTYWLRSVSSCLVPK